MNHLFRSCYRDLAVGAGRLLLIAATATILGCASAPRFNTPLPPGPAFTIDSVYVYSFLDIREKELGPGFMREIEGQLGGALTKLGVKNKQLWFGRSSTRRALALADLPDPSTPRGRSTTVPIGTVISDNQVDERSFGATYRMVAFPSRTTNHGSGFMYEIIWDVFERSTGRRVWTTVSESSHTNMWKADEQPVERAQLLVDGIVSEMQKSGIIGSSRRP